MSLSLLASSYVCGEQARLRVGDIVGVVVPVSARSSPVFVPIAGNLDTEDTDLAVYEQSKLDWEHRRQGCPRSHLTFRLRHSIQATAGLRSLTGSIVVVPSCAM